MELEHEACYRALASRDQRFDGRFFIAVKTTKIYCRPICPARTAKSENVLFYPSAAAAQLAGYRPCLRCRPEAAPDSRAWLGVSNSGASNSVSRALALIEEGALDETRVDALAERLGIGERQLRRLFAQYLGASPIAVAQTRRVLLAQQLIHETQMPLAEIAFAAGFGSIRRFNQVFFELFQRSPSKLRKVNELESAGFHGGVCLLLRYHPPYDWPRILTHMEANAIEGIEMVVGPSYYRSISLDGARGTLAIQQGDGHALQVKIVFPRMSLLAAIIARVRRMFDLSADPEPIVQQLASDPILAKLLTKQKGIRVPGAWDGLESAARIILKEQLSQPESRALLTRLVAAYGQPLEEPHPSCPGLSRIFPEPVKLANAELVALGIPKATATTLKALARELVADPRLLDTRASLTDAMQKLQILPGLSEWAAQSIALRQLREPDAFPAEDEALQQAFGLQTGHRPSGATLLAHAESWRPWRAYAAQLLWESIGTPGS